MLMARPKHPNKDIEKALQYAEAKGWRFPSLKAMLRTLGAGSIVRCNRNWAAECRLGLHQGTPNHVKQIKRIVNCCEHYAENDVENL